MTPTPDADPNYCMVLMQDAAADTALHVAVRHGYAEYVRVLLECGAAQGQVLRPGRVTEAMQVGRP